MRRRDFCHCWINIRLTGSRQDDFVRTPCSMHHSYRIDSIFALSQYLLVAFLVELNYTERQIQIWIPHTLCLIFINNWRNTIQRVCIFHFQLPFMRFWYSKQRIHQPNRMYFLMGGSGSVISKSGRSYEKMRAELSSAKQCETLLYSILTSHCSASAWSNSLFVSFFLWVYAFLRRHRKYCVHTNSWNERIIHIIHMLLFILFLFQVSRAYVWLCAGEVENLTMFIYYLFIFRARRVPFVKAAQSIVPWALWLQLLALHQFSKN